MARRSGGRRWVGILIGLVVVVGVFLGGVVLLGGSGSVGGAAPVAITCIGGSEKSGLMDDEQIRQILDERYGLDVTFRSMGSYDQVTMSDDEIASRDADCLWPSSVSAQFIFEAGRDVAATYPTYDAETVLQSPIVIYAGPNGTQALQKEGIVAEGEGGSYLVLDLQQLTNEKIVTDERWPDGSGVTGPIRVSSTDPATSNSGFTLYQLLLTMLDAEDVYQSPTVAQARERLPALKAIYDSQGLQARSSNEGYEQWLLQGAESFAPLYAGYESQIIEKHVEFTTTGNDTALRILTEDVRILYPEPTVNSDHPILALNADAEAFIEAMRDPEIQEIAWTTYGFRSGVSIGLNDVAQFSDLALAPQVPTTPPPNADVTQLLLACVQEDQC